MDRLLDQIRNEIIMHAKRKITVSYEMLNYFLEPSGDINHNKIDELLKKISIIDYKDSKPILWALVILDNEVIPSDGFFKLLDELGISKYTDSIVERKKQHIIELEKCYSYWVKRRRTGKK